MAYVRVTQKLIDEIESKIHIMRSKAMAALPINQRIDNSDPHCDLLQKEILDLMWEPNKEIRGKVPDEWLSRTDSFGLQVKGSGYSETLRVDVARDGYYRTKACVPPNYARYGSCSMTITEEDMNDMADCELKRRLVTMMDAAVKAGEIRQRFASIEGQVLSFFKSHTSVNTAVKEVEQMRLYLPDDVLRKLDEKVERKPRAAKTTHQSDDNVVELDINTLTAAAIASRMG